MDIEEAIDVLERSAPVQTVRTRLAEATRLLREEVKRLRAVVAPSTEDDRQNVEDALRCVANNSECHWPTVAGILGAEVEYLRAELRGRAVKADPDAGISDEESQRFGMPTVTAVNYLRALAESPHEALQHRQACTSVLEELERLRNHIETAPNEKAEALPGLSFSFDGGVSSTYDLARIVPEEWRNYATVDLRILSAHLTTVLDSVTAALQMQRGER